MALHKNEGAPSSVDKGEEVGQKAHNQKTIYRKKRHLFVISNREVRFVIIALSAILVASGAFLILEAIGLLLVSQASATLSQTPIDLLLSSFSITKTEQAISLITIGSVLVASPLVLNRFFYDSFRHERELNIRAEKSMREAQLLQDILTHDLRNYSQVSRMSAELIGEELLLESARREEDPNENNGQRHYQSVQELVGQLIKSIDNSTLLVERAKLLGRVISDLSEERYPMDVLESIKRSITIVEANARSEKDNVGLRNNRIQCICKLGTLPPVPLEMAIEERESTSTNSTKEPSANVLADSLLDHVFVNLFSNSLKYSERSLGMEHPEQHLRGHAFVSVEMEQVHGRRPSFLPLRGRGKRAKASKTPYWKVSIADVGNGITDEVKRTMFSRLEGKRTNGLGMSIVYALIVERYGGKIQVRDRVDGDRTRGTVVDLWLPKATSGSTPPLLIS